MKQAICGIIGGLLLNSTSSAIELSKYLEPEPKSEKPLVTDPIALCNNLLDPTLLYRLPEDISKGAYQEDNPFKISEAHEKSQVIWFDINDTKYTLVVGFREISDEHSPSKKRPEPISFEVYIDDGDYNVNIRDYELDLVEDRRHQNRYDDFVNELNRIFGF